MTKVTIYVRRGTQRDERWLSFAVPRAVPQEAILDQGWAIDGNQVLLSVPKRELLDAERLIAAWLTDHQITGVAFA